MIIRNLARAAIEKLQKTALQEPFGWRGATCLLIDNYIIRKHKSKPHLSPSFADTQKIVQGLKSQGYYAIENFISRQHCELLVSRLDSVLEKNPSLIHPATPYDHRLHGVEQIDDEFLFFAQHPLLQEIADIYLEEPARVAFTLGARLAASPDNPGSGGGWHRDNFINQFKAMLYLTDTGSDNGPFQLLAGSHHLGRILKDNRILARPYGNVRMTEDDIDALLAKTGPARLHTLTAKAGTVLLFDSRTIHRGAPIRKGVRYALTDYFYPSREITDELYRHFHPVARMN